MIYRAFLVLLLGIGLISTFIDDGSKCQQQGQSSHTLAQSNEGPCSYLDRSTIPCPPLHHTMVHDVVVPSQIEVEGRSMNPEVVHNSPVHIGQFTMN